MYTLETRIMKIGDQNDNEASLTFANVSFSVV